MSHELHEFTDAGGGRARLTTPELGHARLDVPGGGWLVLTPELALRLAGLLESWYQRRAPDTTALEDWARGRARP